MKHLTFSALCNMLLVWKCLTCSVADPGFPVAGGRGPRRRGCVLPRWLRFENFVCQNERTGTLRGARAPLDPPMTRFSDSYVVLAQWRLNWVLDVEFPNTNLCTTLMFTSCVNFLEKLRPYKWCQPTTNFALYIVSTSVLLVAPRSARGLVRYKGWNR